MYEVCKDCLFSDAVEDETYMACQARQMLIMPFDKVCDFFEEKGCVCEECTMDKYANTTELPGVKILEQDEDDIIEYASMQGLTEAIQEIEEECDCGCCNANSYPEEEEDIDPMIEVMMEDLDLATTEVLENLAFLGDGTNPEDVLGPILGLEATIACLKRFLLEYEE